MPVPVISVAQMREWEAATWAGGQTEGAVIARVGEQLAQRALETTRAGDRIIVLAGKGHNGDDARAMLPHLHARDVRLIVARDAVMASVELQKHLQGRAALVVDGLLGIGLKGPLSHDWLSLIALVNHAHTPILAVDCPSGLDAQTGAVATAAIQATETLTVGAPKRGLLTLDAAAYVGRLIVLPDVGLVPCRCQSDVLWTLSSDFTNFPPRRLVSTHKGSFGHLGIIAGSRGYHGAGVLAAKGAQRARPGLITLLTQPEIHTAASAQLASPMVGICEGDPHLEQFTALLFGPGLAAPGLPDTVSRTAAEAWKEFEGPVIVDASALAWLPEGDVVASAPRLITPHPGEAARLLGCSTSEVQSNRVESARALSRKLGRCWVVLKGHQTVIARDGESAFVNSSGGPGLAQGGSGDLLSGYIAGWLAQPLLSGEALQVIRYAVWEHGAAADRLDRIRANWIVEELAVELGRGAVV